HSFHIPVMGLAYTIDSPIKVARFGISSVISIIEDRLVEMMRSHYYPAIDLVYNPISTHEDDFRAKRITDYLNLVNTIVQHQIEQLRQAAFETGSEVVTYFEMLPEDHRLKHMYRQMTKANNLPEKKEIEGYLRSQIRPGRIDVNIMTKIDRNKYTKDGECVEDGSDAVSALRGYVKSDLVNSAVVFSAGLNPRVYSYLENCNAFDANENGEFVKKIIVKVSDYRSALIQGKYLAKKGIWVSEFRIESGLNCGGHAFATEGYLLGPVLEEFKTNKKELIATLFELYTIALQKKNSNRLASPPDMAITVQGGIGTHEEDEFLHRYYHVESTGWGTPFLLVPEATTVDENTLELLRSAKEKDVELSRISPLGVRFYSLKGTTAENEKSLRISQGKPGSPCTEKLLAFNTEFTIEPICTASHKYQKLKINQLQSLNLPEAEYEKQLQQVQEKECLCLGLSNSASIAYNRPFIKKLNAVTICPGPNIANFSKIVSLQTMTDHIYGRSNIMTNPNRSHMFIAEILLYIDFLKEQLEEDSLAGALPKKGKYYTSFYSNLKEGIAYYRSLAGIAADNYERFCNELFNAEKELDNLHAQYTLVDL
ncbi:MAG TPA: hypothetical protein PLV75_11155, partial [Saprospiraceae bacterium]|nr:hypothetical protein [Saprospiraceae bacterium]